jgi:2-oxoglutarate dehydrogenase E2 component (dihydrolipoamide succinyltransferase)
MITMAIDVKAPALGESVSEIYVGKWYKSPGDDVAKDEPLVELESDKATVDLPAAESGKLGEILKPSGSTVEVGEVLATIEKGAPKESAKTEAPKPKAEQAPSAEAEAPPGTEEAASAPAKPIVSYGDIAGPVAGSEDDTVEPAAESAPAAKPQADRQRPAPTAKPKPPAEPEPAALRFAAPSTEAGRAVERVPMSPLRRRIALRLVEAQQQAALLTTFNEADMSAIKQLRSELGEAFEKKHGVRLGFMSFFVKAAIAALEQFPQLNAMIEESDIVYRRFYDVGIAVSTERGLVVPVLRNVERMSFAEIERAIEEFAGRARKGELKVEDLQGGTFTITNGGIFGSLLSTPIINPPQSGVLGMHTIQDRPIARGGEVVIRPMMYLALTYDHRLVDGREAVQFLTQIKQALENPTRLFLDV